MKLEKLFRHKKTLVTTLVIFVVVVTLFFLRLSTPVYDPGHEIKTPQKQEVGIVVATSTQQVASSTVVSSASADASSTPAISVPLSHYIEIIDGCGPYYDTGVCVNVRSGAGLEFPVLLHLRTGVVLKVEGTKIETPDGMRWYKVVLDGWVRYPERVEGDWYVADTDSVRAIEDVGEKWAPVGTVATTTKRIEVSLSEKMLYAYDGENLFMKEPTSPGLESTPTPRGSFTVYYKTPSRYMQGPIPEVSDQYYDLPGVPWNLYFTQEGAVIHGAYWHNNFGKRWSHGCVNLAPHNAEKLYHWAEIGMPVLVRD